MTVLLLRLVAFVYVCATSGFVAQASAEAYGWWGIVSAFPICLVAGVAMGVWFGLALNRIRSRA